MIEVTKPRIAIWLLVIATAFFVAAFSFERTMRGKIEAAGLGAFCAIAALTILTKKKKSN